MSEEKNNGLSEEKSLLEVKKLKLKVVTPMIGIKKVVK